MPRPPRRARPVPVQHEWSEADLQREVLNLCKMYGLLAYHTHDSRRSQPGYPDLTIVGPGGVLFVELKNATRQLEPEQEQWRDALQAAGQQWRLWRPVDFFSRAIPTELSMLRRPREVAPLLPSPWGNLPGPPNYCGPRCAEGHTCLWGTCELATPPADNRPTGGCPGCGATLGGAIGHMAGCRLAGR